MRIIINDFGGYPFPVQLSKHLAALGYNVLHTYVSNIQTPHGNMEAAGNHINLKIVPIVLINEFKKYSFIGRYKGELEYAKKVNLIIEDFKPDIFLSANTPLFAQDILFHKCKKKEIKFIYWCQDIHSIALENYLTRRLHFIGKAISNFFRKKELRLLQQSDFVILISEGFNSIFKKWGISQKNIAVIENWGPISEIELKPKSNSWSKKLKLDLKLVVLYSGTLGIKHNPDLIYQAAEHFNFNNNVCFVVISEGTGADLLTKLKHKKKINNLIILPYQDYSELSNVLAASDILLSILEESAAMYSVPSKVLTYLCAQKPIVLSISKKNLSAQIVKESQSGYCVEPNDFNGFIESISILINDAGLRKNIGYNGRKYAEENFDITLIANKFTDIFNKVSDKSTVHIPSE